MRPPMITGERGTRARCFSSASRGFNEAPDDHGGEAAVARQPRDEPRASMRPPMITGERVLLRRDPARDASASMRPPMITGERVLEGRPTSVLPTSFNEAPDDHGGEAARPG